MTLAQLFLIHRYKVDSVHYLTPTDDNHRQTERMKDRGHLHASSTTRSGRSSSPTSTRSASASWSARRGALAELIGSRCRCRPIVGTAVGQSWASSQAPTLGHRFWLADRPTTIPTWPPSMTISEASSLPTRS